MWTFTPWKAMSKALTGTASVTVQNGANTAFWEDRWLGAEPLCSTYPALYSHVAQHGASVREIVSQGIPHFLVPRLSCQARAELAAVQLSMSGWELIAGDDNRRSNLQTSEGRLMTSKIYKLATSSENACDHYIFVWKNYAPPKVKFFAWLLLQNRIQCSSNLKKKNILESDSCVLCSHAAETADHLMASCPFAQSF